MRRRERLAWAALLALALALRLAALGERPPHHDEAVHAHFADVLVTQRAYRYDPTYHGPLLFYTMGALFVVLGETLAVARLYPALAGVALVALPLALRRRIGPAAAWWSGAVLALSPSFVYYSRFARNDVPVALFTAAALVVLAGVRRDGGRLIPWVGVLAALHAISKETFYVTCPLLAGGAAAAAVRCGVRRSLARGLDWARGHAFRIGTAVLWFVAIAITAYTFGFVHPEDFAFPLKAISYWYSQHEIQRVGGPWHYHLPRLGLYEFLIAGAALAWAARRGAQMGRLEVFCLAWAGLAVGTYAYLGEKTPWLLVHQVLPLVPLAGAQLARAFSGRGRWWSRGLAAAGLAATAWSTVASSFLYPTITTADPHAELIVFVQTTPEAGALARRGAELAAAAPDDLLAAVSGEGSWPLSWQWRRLRVAWGLPAAGSRPHLAVCDPGDETAVRERLGAGYAARRMPLRGWWVEEWGGVGPLDVAHWFATREAWSPIGATDVTVFERAPGGAAGEEGGTR
jgi:uncharacterized protein (TIGR03663 family)